MEEKDIYTLVSDYAIENFKKGLNCAESVTDALIRAGAIPDSPDARAMSIGFGGGIGLAGLTCGALSSAVMANGCVHGRRDPWSVPDESRGSEIAEKYYRRYNNLAHDFISANGSGLCREICEPFGDFHGKERRVNCMKLIGKTAALAYGYIMKGQEEAFALPYKDNLGGNE